MELPVQYPPILLLFFGTLARYNIISFTVPANVTGDKFRFMRKKRRILQAISISSLLISIYLLTYLSLWQIAYLSHLGLLTFWYLFPIPLGFTKIKPLRKVPYLKIFIIAYVWVGSSFAMPLIEENGDWLNQQFLFLFLERILFIFAITLPFDIKDLEDDMRMKLRTIPSKIGIKRTKWLSLTCLSVGAAIIGCYFSGNILWGMLAGYALTITSIGFMSSQKNELYYLGLIDGTMVIQFTTLWLALNT